MNKKPPTQRVLAEALGISQSMVSKLHAKGMPVDNVAAAEQWRARNVDGGLSKDVRPLSGGSVWRGGAARNAPPNYGIGHWTGWSNVNGCLDLIHEMGRRAGPNFEGWAEPLRAALRLLPPAYWDAVDLPDLIWDDLIALSDTPDGILGNCSIAVLDPQFLDEFPDAKLVARHWLFMCACGLVAAVPTKEI